MIIYLPIERLMLILMQSEKKKDILVFYKHLKLK